MYRSSIGAVSLNTADLVVYQQKKKGAAIHPHGHPDPATLVDMGTYRPEEYWPEEQLEYVRGGSKPSTFFRDLQGVSNQVPQWIWLTVGGATLAYAFFTWRSSKR